MPPAAGWHDGSAHVRDGRDGHMYWADGRVAVRDGHARSCDGQLTSEASGVLGRGTASDGASCAEEGSTAACSATGGAVSSEACSTGALHVCAPAASVAVDARMVRADGAGSGRPSASRQCADVLMLLHLAMLPPPQANSSGSDVFAHRVGEGGRGVDEGGGTLGHAAYVLGAALEVFLQYWLRQLWPLDELRRALRAQLHGSALALCWLLECRPALVAQAELGPELLLEAIRVASSPRANASGADHPRGAR
jgi:hypothetical protein